MELKDTIEMMNSEDYKERFKAEYYQLRIRYEKLGNMYLNWDSLKFIPTCPKETYRDQLCSMEMYLNVLEDRAELENIELDDET